MEAIFILVIGGLILIGILAHIFWVWMIIDCIMNEPSEGNEKVLWLLLIIFLAALGAFIYFLARRPQRMRELGR